MGNVSSDCSGVAAEGAYEVGWYPFDERPLSDSCWSLSVGPDGRIYAAVCCEHTPGQSVALARYNERTDSLDYLFDLDEKVDDPRDSGRATQCKIHYSFAPSMSEGILYMATHLSGPPVDMKVYSPWLSWHDERRCFRGSALVAFDTASDEVLWWDTMFPKEGCRCMVHDEQRGLLYSLTYPRDHMFVYDIKRREGRDLGRIGSVNSQAIFLDSQGRVWTSDDYGHIVRYDPQTDRLSRSPYVLPHDRGLQSGWHNVLYDVVAAPDGQCVYAVCWNGGTRLMRIWMNEGQWGRVEDLGAVNQQFDTTLPVDFLIDHCGGLTFGGDGLLYYVASRWNDAEDGIVDPEGVVWRMDPQTLRREQVVVLKRPDTKRSNYVPRGAVDHNGDLFFGAVSKPPVGIYKVHMPESRKTPDAHLPIRMWG